MNVRCDHLFLKTPGNAATIEIFAELTTIDSEVFPSNPYATAADGTVHNVGVSSTVNTGVATSELYKIP